MNLRTRPARIGRGRRRRRRRRHGDLHGRAAGTASADEPGRCLQNVNVREEPDVDSRIVAMCEAGTKVEIGAERDGFVRTSTNLGGWASRTSSRPTRPPAPATPAADRSGEARRPTRRDSRLLGERAPPSSSSTTTTGRPGRQQTGGRAGGSGERRLAASRADSGDVESERPALGARSAARTWPAASADPARVSAGSAAARRRRPTPGTPAEPSSPTAARSRCRRRRAASPRCPAPRTRGRRRPR